MGGTTKPTEPASPHAGPTAEQIWRQVVKASFAVISEITSKGDPRSSGVLYTIVDRRMYVVVGTGSWKARHIAADGRVAVTIPVRRGGILALMFSIPPATISFHGSATVYPASSPEGERVLDRLGHLLPPMRLAGSSVVEIRPEGNFLTYGIGVTLLQMRDPARSQARVPVV